MRTFAEKLNPSIKLITILILVILISFQYRIMLNLSIFVFSLLLVFLGSHNAPKKVLKILIPAFFAAFGLFMMGLYYARGSSKNSYVQKSDNCFAAQYQTSGFCRSGHLFCADNQW